LHLAVGQGVIFDTQCLEIAKLNYLFLVVHSLQLKKPVVSCADRDVCNLVANPLFCLDCNVVFQVLLHILEMPLYSDAGSGRLHSAFSEVISYI